VLPFLYRSDNFALPTYLVLNSLVFCFGVIWAARKADREGLNRNLVLDLVIWFMLGAFVGARAAHVLWELPQVYWEHPSYIFQFWLGGFVFYGGSIGALITTLVFCRLKKISFLRMADFLTPIFSLGYAIGRLGCLAAGCCFGRECQMPWAIHFPEGVEAPAHVPLHPTQLYASFLELLVFAVVYTLDRRKKFPIGSVFAVWLVLHGISRFIVEQYRADFRGFSLAGLSISSFISLIALAAGGILFQKLRQRPYR